MEIDFNKLPKTEIADVTHVSVNGELYELSDRGELEVQFNEDGTVTLK